MALSNGSALTDAQVAAVAAFEAHHGRAYIVPPGPRRDRFLKWAGYGAIAVASDRTRMEPDVIVVEADGAVDIVEEVP